MRINHNIAALNTYRQLNTANGAQSKSMEKLSSGMRINRAGDDAAGLAISEKMRGQIRGLDMASKNAQDGISLIATAEGALNETHAILQRMRELATQASNDTNEVIDRTALQEEFTNLRTEISRISTTTEFNEKKLLNGSLNSSITATGTDLTAAKGISNIKISGAAAGTYELTYNNTTKEMTLKDTAVGGKTVTVNVGTVPTDFNTKEISFGDMGVAVSINKDLTADIATAATAQFTVGAGGSINLQIGANETQRMNISIGNMSSTSLGLDALTLDNHTNAGAAMTAVNTAINTVSTERSKLGAYQNRLEHTINNLTNASENLTAAESRVRDVDMAKEMMNQTKNSILSQAAQAMLAQANQQPQGVLQLLR